MYIIQESFGINWELLKFDLRKRMMKTGAVLSNERTKEENALLKDIISLNNIALHNISETQARSYIRL